MGHVMTPQQRAEKIARHLNLDPEASWVKKYLADVAFEIEEAEKEAVQEFYFKALEDNSFIWEQGFSEGVAMHSQKCDEKVVPLVRKGYLLGLEDGAKVAEACKCPERSHCWDHDIPAMIRALGNTPPFCEHNEEDCFKCYSKEKK